MGADSQDMIGHLMIQLAQQPTGPSLYGLQAQTDPNNIRAVLSKLKQQQVLDQANAPTGGQYGYLHDAGKNAFNSIGSSLGGQLAAFGNGPQQGPSPQIQSQRDAISAGNQGVSSDLAGGVDPEQTKINALTKAAQAGLPGAAEALDKAVEAQQKTLTTKAQAFKDIAQGNSATDEIKNRAFNQSTKTWQTVYTDPNGLFMLQKNGQGETKRVELKPPPSTSAQAAANMDPQSIQFAADTYRTTGKFPGSFGKSPALQMAVLKQVAQDALTNGDTAGSIQARTQSLKAGGEALGQVSKQEAMTGSFVATMDKNLQALTTLKDKVDNTGSPLVNKVINHFQQGVAGDPDTAAYVTMLNSVASEFAKIQSGSMGNTPVSDASRQEARDTINKAMSSGGIAAVAQVMRQESQNRMQSIREAKQGLIGSLSGNAPGAPQGGPPPPAAAAPQAATPTSVPEGQTATNKQTGQKVIFKGGAWVPVT